jgi:cytoskeletal protein CcmA (bactofilin family)
MNQRAEIGSSVVVKGDLIAQEDVTIAGRVQGTVRVPGHLVMVTPGGHVAADIAARAIVVAGTVHGAISAEETIEVQESAVVVGNLMAPRIRMAEGAAFHGRVDMPPRRKLVVLPRAS